MRQLAAAVAAAACLTAGCSSASAQHPGQSRCRVTYWAHVESATPGPHGAWLVDYVGCSHG
jgi:hypothetical protein